MKKIFLTRDDKKLKDEKIVSNQIRKEIIENYSQGRLIIFTFYISLSPAN